MTCWWNWIEGGGNVRIQAVIETAVYVDDLRAAEAFYRTVLGLPVIGKEPGRPSASRRPGMRAGHWRRRPGRRRGGPLPPHGATGPGHFALGIEAKSFDAWRKHLQGHGVSIEKEVEWPRGGKSFYFRDPAGNSVELVTPGLWGLPSGW